MMSARTVRLALFASAVVALMLNIPGANAQEYGGVRETPPGAASAELADPFDPMPEIHCWHDCAGPCQHECGRRERCERDCRAWYDPCCDRAPPIPSPPIPPLTVINVDCSGQSYGSDHGDEGDSGGRHGDHGGGHGHHPGDDIWFDSHGAWTSSIQAALHYILPNGTIRILPPGQGTTCVESLQITEPVTLETYGGGQGAVIQAPDGQPCIQADIALGDSLKLNGLKIIARGHEAPCVQVRAGRVEVADSDIDSRNTNWAFDVSDSGALKIRNTSVQTDGSGVHAYRAYVEIAGLRIDMSPNRTDAALQLERTDGSVEKVDIVGGRWGVLASPGAHGLTLSDVDVLQANTGVELIAGAQGAIQAERLWLFQNRNGLVVGPYVTVNVKDSKIFRSQDTGAVLFGADATLKENRIHGGRIGVRVARADEFSWTDVPMRPIDDPIEASAPTLVGNHIGRIGEADIFADAHARAQVFHNQLWGPPGCSCLAGDKDALIADGNSCDGSPMGDEEGDGIEGRPSRGWLEFSVYVGFGLSVSVP